MNCFVLDTSVIVKWFSASQESDLENALWLRQAIFENQCQAMIPDLVFYELGNALRFHPQFTAADVEQALQSLVAMQLTIMAVAQEILTVAIHLAFQCDVTLYDAYFLALAQITGNILITADNKLYQRAKSNISIVHLHDIFDKNLDKL